MRKLLSFILLLCLNLNAFAGVGGTLKLERLIDDYQYVVTVEWDQKNQQFYDQETQKFFAGMQKLIQEESLTKAEVLTLMEKKLVSKNTLESLKLKLSLLSKNESSEDLAKALKDSAKDMYSQGANWNGEVIIPLAIGIVVIAALAYKWWWDVHHKCVAWEEKYECSTSSWDDRSCWTEYDEDGTSYQECDYYWQQEVTTTCGMMNSCTEYEKI